GVVQYHSKSACPLVHIYRTSTLCGPAFNLICPPAGRTPPDAALFTTTWSSISTALGPLDSVSKAYVPTRRASSVPCQRAIQGADPSDFVASRDPIAGPLRPPLPPFP